MEQYNVTGMSCAACSARVEKAVSAVPGVRSCAVSLLTNSMGVEGNAKEADIIIAAIGIPFFVKEDMVKEGAVIVDVGINSIEDPSRKSGYRLVGDVDFDKVAPKCSYITPVPGGVGPMTIASLLQNTLKAYKNRK